MADRIREGGDHSVLSICLQLIVMLGYALPQTSSQTSKYGNPIACNLSDGELRERRETILKVFRQSLLGVTPLPLGFAYHFQRSSEVLTCLTQLVDLERQCCPFLTFKIIVGAGDLPICLEVTGTSEAKEVIADLFGFFKGEKQIPPRRKPRSE